LLLAPPGEHLLDIVAARRSAPRLADPGPSVAELATMLRAAAAAPDHGRLRPWRFTVFTGTERCRFGAVLAEALRRRDPAADEARLAKERCRLERAPAVVAVAAAVTECTIAPAEQVAAVHAATQNLLLAATALGYGSMWRTGITCTDPHVRASLGLAPADVLVGFVYLGTVPVEPPPRPAPTLDGVVRTWTEVEAGLPPVGRPVPPLG
jgi:nitroreductase